MQVTQIYNPNREGAEVRVHKAGCRDIARDLRGSTSHDTIEAVSQTDAVNEFWQDFIGEGSMTENQAFSYTEFLPCAAGLPVHCRGELTIAAE